MKRRVIYKYPCPAQLGEQRLEVPEEALVLSVGLQEVNGAQCPVIWALVDPDAPRNIELVWLFFTGDELGPHIAAEDYLATVQRDDGIVIHVFSSLREVRT